MNGDYDRADEGAAAPRRRRLLAYALLPGLFFLLGLGAMGWLLSHWDAGARMIGIAPAPPPAARVAAPPAPAPALPRPAPASGSESDADADAAGEEPERIVIDPEITRRVAALERRIGQVDSQSRAAVGNADRAEGLLVAFAVRRALDRGVALGFLEALLRQRFGDTEAAAVGTIIAAARQPVTLQELQDELQRVGPLLIGAGPQQSWWGALRAELGGLVTVRRENSPSTEPTERLRRARSRLEAGQVDVALAEVLRLPGRDHAGEWIGDARRYVLARQALDAIENAALLEPHTAPPPRPRAGPPAAPAAAR